MVPLVKFTSEKEKMGEFANRRWVAVLAWIVAGAIIVVNCELLWLTARDWFPS